MANKDFQNGFALGLASGGAGSSMSQVQSDWEENDSSKSSYIKNKPFSTETQKIDYVSFFAKDAEPNSKAIWTDAINLVAGHTYSVDIITDTDTTNIQVTATEAPEEEGFGFPVVILDGTVNDESIFYIFDAIDMDSNEEPIRGNRAFGFIYNEIIKEIRVHKDNISFLRSNIDSNTNLIWTDTIGLVAGNTYSIDMITDTGTTNLQLTAIHAAEGLGFNCVALAYASGEQLLFQIIDTVDIDSGSGELISGNKTCCGLYNTTIQGVRVYGVSPTVTIVNKLSNEYINLDQTYSPESENAQSGIAVAEAIKKVDQTEKLLLFPRDTIIIKTETSTNQVRLIYRIDLERVEINEETKEVTIIPLRTNIPDIHTWYEDGDIVKELLGEITRVNFRVSNDFVGITDPGYSYLDEEEINQAVTEAGATYERRIFLDSGIGSYNVLEVRLIASSTDLGVLSAIRDELFTILKDGTESLALQYKTKPILEKLISEVI